jgi:hypothetical protein
MELVPDVVVVVTITFLGSSGNISAQGSRAEVDVECVEESIGFELLNGSQSLL